MLLLFALACGADPLPPLALPPADVSVVVDDKAVASGEPVHLTVRLRAAPGWQVPAPALAAEGLALTEASRSGPTETDGAATTAIALEARGPDGSYVLAAPPVHATGPAGEDREIAIPPLFVDIGVQGPTGGALADFEVAAPPPPARWPYVAGAVGLLALGGLLWYRRRRAAPPPPPPFVPAHLRARAAWDQVRAAGLDDHAQALRLSGVFREYLDEALGWPATTRTSREILAHLEAEARLSLADRGKAADILDATDRVKFARDGGGEAFFAALDEAFSAVVEATRPPDQPAPGSPSPSHS